MITIFKKTMLSLQFASKDLSAHEWLGFWTMLLTHRKYTNQTWESAIEAVLIELEWLCNELERSAT